MKHCWHTTNVIKPTNPPIKEAVCCFCGKKGDVKYKSVVPEGHGRYSPQVLERCSPDMDEECPVRKKTDVVPEVY